MVFTCFYTGTKLLKLGEIISACKADTDRVQAKHKYVINISVPARLKNRQFCFRLKKNKQFFILKKKIFEGTS